MKTKVGKITRLTPEEIYQLVDKAWILFQKIYDSATLDENQEWVFQKDHHKELTETVKGAVNPKHWKLPVSVTVPVKNFFKIIEVALAALWYNGDGEYVITFDVASDKYTIKTNGYQCW